MGKQHNKEIHLMDPEKIMQLKITAASDRVKQVFENLLYQVLCLASQESKIVIRAKV